MKEVRLLATSQVRLFPPDLFPLSKFISGKYRDTVQSLFNFQGVNPLVEQNVLLGIRFANGSFGPKMVRVDHVTIEDRKIVIKVDGTSKEATAIYKKFKTQLEEFNEKLPIEEILCTHETVSSVVLNVPFERVFSRPFLSFIQKSATKLTQNQWSENYILPAELRFSIRYKVTDDELSQNYISLAPKELRIEPRAQSALKDRLYWITSPTDTDTHFKLINDLEKALAAGN